MASTSWKRWTHAGTALVVSAALVAVCDKGVGPLPPNGPTFNPGTGVWTAAEDAKLPTSQTLHIPGLNKPVQVSFDAQGTAYIHAQTDHDLFLTLGYLHAKNRLFQMDLMRRQGEGRLSEIVGKAALPSDAFELQLGLLRTAQQSWQQMAQDDPARSALLAYTAGVNACIQEDERTGQLPLMFKLSATNRRPGPRWIHWSSRVT